MVYGATARVLLPIALVALVGAGMWGYQEHNEKNSVLIKAENSYQRAFHDLTYHIDKLHDELGKSLVVNSRRQMTPTLTNVWRLAYAAQSDVGQLPLTLMPFSNTEEMLSRVADFSYRVAVRDLDKEPLSDKEYGTLKSLHKQAQDIQDQLRNVQANVIDKQLRWMDVETALASDDKKSDNTIVDGFQTIEKKVQEFPDLDWGVGIQSLDKKKQQRIQGIDGKPATAEDAKKSALEFLRINASDAKVEVDENGKGQTYTAYSVRVIPNGQKAAINLDVTKRGGKVVWMMNEREIGEEKLDMKQAQERGEEFLRKHGFGDMVVSEIDSYDRNALFTFVPVQDGVRIYPDSVTIEIALDNGEVTAFNSTEYLFNHKQRLLSKPRLSKEEARKKVNPSVKVTSERLALIEGKNDGKEVLTWELTGSFEGNSYMVYINAMNGDEEEVVKMETGTDRENQQ
ncbi:MULTISPECIES: germination protein YpeB [Brevibacillus]|jgi:germination protein YpeB|uniref:Germination protein YpeB n=1 Tax=Brevibacillus parabrevis TaxID=54914 RepID=A0A4Y3PQR6_BREPA|nr:MULTISPECIES: germination protein YpeB [Brevibacillus]MBU8712127.1 germination protein YpeB [Brevibacillus parabrevis]MDH6349195.1 spore germination protein [Brevibacillus sp. 1238]MDR5001209.1 germination protein YpeB [Brevibacillus parabrevis]MED2257533.1 germination protein YpeB [Brevibacillus parabrevis]NRQ52223.1 germination protein YpeB [Brevibacillus sp. HD1.4A]